MKKRRKAKKIGFFARYAWLIVAAVVLAVLSSAAFSFVIYEKKAEAIAKKVSAASEQADSSKLAAIVSTIAATFLPSDASAPAFSPLDLSYDTGVYVYSKKKHVCNDYRNVIKPNYFSLRCKVDEGIWRGHLVKKIDVAGYSKLRVRAGLGVKDYTDYFAECGHKGVNRDDFTALMALSYDPEQTFRWDCNHEVVEEKWQMCQVEKNDPGVMAYCGVPMCSNSASCDFEIDVSKKEAVYLLFSVNDVWAADIEGSLSNAEYALTK